MKTLIIVACVLAYLAIGFLWLVNRARKYAIDLEDVTIAMLFWPIVMILYLLYFLSEKIKRMAIIYAERIDAKLPK